MLHSPVYTKNKPSTELVIIWNEDVSSIHCTRFHDRVMSDTPEAVAYPRRRQSCTQDIILFRILCDLHEQIQNASQLLLKFLNTFRRK